MRISILEEIVFAILAAVMFGLALLFDLLKTNLGSTISIQTLTLAGLFFVALHLTGAGAWSTWRRR